MKKRMWAPWALIMSCQPAFAHEPLIPLLHCWRETADVVCEARWTNDVAVPHARYEVTDARDKTLLSGQTDSQGRLRFVPPAPVFHVLLWDAHDKQAEVGWRDVKGDAAL